jgi:hypothetical protein
MPNGDQGSPIGGGQDSLFLLVFEGSDITIYPRTKQTGTGFFIRLLPGVGRPVEVQAYADRIDRTG